MSDIDFPSYKVASIQINPVIADVDSNLVKISEKIIEASKSGAVLVVLPELANTGYVFNSREEAFSLAEMIPEGRTTQLLLKLSKDLNVYIACGITEDRKSVV